MKKVKAWETSDGQTFSTVDDAQRHELGLVLQKRLPMSATADDPHEEMRTGIIELLLENADAVVDILTLKDESRPAARGTTRKPRGRKPAETAPTPTSPVPSEQEAA